MDKGLPSSQLEKYVKKLHLARTTAALRSHLDQQRHEWRHEGHAQVRPAHQVLQREAEGQGGPSQEEPYGQTSRLLGTNRRLARPQP